MFYLLNYWLTYDSCSSTISLAGTKNETIEAYKTSVCSTRPTSYTLRVTLLNWTILLIYKHQTVLLLICSNFDKELSEKSATLTANLARILAPAPSPKHITSFTLKRNTSNFHPAISCDFRNTLISATHIYQHWLFLPTAASSIQSIYVFTYRCFTADSI